MPWLIIEYIDDKNDFLSKKFNIKLIPSLILMKRNGGIVNTNAINDVKSGSKAYFSWKEKEVFAK